MTDLLVSIGLALVNAWLTPAPGPTHRDIASEPEPVPVVRVVQTRPVYRKRTTEPAPEKTMTLILDRESDRYTAQVADEVQRALEGLKGRE